MKRRSLTYLIALTPVALFVLLLFRQVLLSQIPVTEKRIPARIAADEIPIPRRPGSQSIRIVGPPLKSLKFEIDFKKDPMPLDWSMLEQIDKRADIRVDASIDDAGLLTITRVRDRGHPQAGRYLRSVLSTWQFRPYKMGKIRFYFNVPTHLERMKVQIDVSQMERNAAFLTDRIVVRDGVLCYVQGLQRNNIVVLK